MLPFRLQWYLLPLSAQCAATLTINMTHKHIVMQLSSAWEAFEKKKKLLFLSWRVEKHITAESLSHTSKCGGERVWEMKRKQRKREREILGRCKLPAGSHSRHLPVIFSEPSCYRGWQVFWPGDTDGWLNLYAAGASSKGPGYSIAIFALIFPLMFYSELEYFNTRRPMCIQVGKMDARLSVEMQGCHVMVWNVSHVLCVRETENWNLLLLIIITLLNTFTNSP